MKTKKKIRAMYVESLEDSRNTACVVFVARLKERNHSKDLGIDERIIIKWFINKGDAWTWPELIWVRIR